MTEDQKRFIVDRLGKIPQVELSRLTGVSQTSISLLKKRMAARESAAQVPHDRRRDRRYGSRR